VGEARWEVEGAAVAKAAMEPGKLGVAAVDPVELGVAAADPAEFAAVGVAASEECAAGQRAVGRGNSLAKSDVRRWSAIAAGRAGMGCLQTRKEQRGEGKARQWHLGRAV
jgi:hypothetical protein